MARTRPAGMTGAQIGVLLNRHRQMLQNETADIGDAITVSVFVLWSFLMDQERAGGFSAAEAMQYLAAENARRSAEDGAAVCSGWPRMSRFDLTRILKPTGLQPPLTGPRDALPATVHKLAGDEDETPTATTPKGNTMTNAQRILAALAKKSPADLTYLEKATGISRGVLGVTLPLLVKGKAIERSPHQRGIYGLPGTTFLIGGGAAAKATKAASSTKRTYGKRKPKAGSPESFAAGVKAIEREQASTGTNGTSLLARVERVNGVDHPDGARLARALIMRHEATALPCRAIATAAGGAIVLRGNTLTAELSAEEVNVIHQLRG